MGYLTMENILEQLSRYNPKEVANKINSAVSYI